MKYFEVHEPYYAMLKATNEEEALKLYTEVVADDDDGNLANEIQEISHDYALVKFSRVPGEDKELVPVDEILETFNSQDVEVLIIDGSLI